MRNHEAQQATVDSLMVAMGGAMTAGYAEVSGRTPWFFVLGLALWCVFRLARQ